MNKHKIGIFQNQELGFGGLLKRCLIILGVSVVLSLLITLLFSAIFYNLPDPTSRINTASLFSMYVTVFVSGIILSKVNKQKYLAGGIILGIMLLIINLVLSFIFNKDISTSDYIWKLLIPVFCVLGSMLGIKKERKRHFKKRY